MTTTTAGTAVLANTTHPGGSDATVVLLHSLALDGSIWAELLEQLLPRVTVLTPDLPNHGATAGVPRDTMEAMADEVARLVRSDVGGPAVIVGMSLGGCVAQAMAVHHPDTVAGLGLVATTAWYGERAEQDWAARAERARTEGLASLAAFQLERWFSGDFVADNRDFTDRLVDVLAANDLDAYAATCRAMGSFDSRSRLADVTVPTSIIVGADDQATTPEHAFDLFDRISGAGLHVLPGCGHLAALQHPVAVAGFITRDVLARL